MSRLLDLVIKDQIMNGFAMIILLFSVIFLLCAMNREA